MEEESKLRSYEDIMLFSFYYPVKGDTIIVNLSYEEYRQLWIDYLLDNPEESPGTDNVININLVNFKILVAQ